jgi:hypothetical protein
MTNLQSGEAVFRPVDTLATGATAVAVALLQGS